MTQTFHTQNPPWHEDGDEVVLIGQRCEGCGKRFFPTTELCDRCDGTVFSPVELEPRGQLYSYSEIHVAPRAFPTPYVVGYIDFGDDLRVFGQVVGTPSDLEVGCRVRPVLGEIRLDAEGVPVRGYRFEKEEIRHA